MPTTGARRKVSIRNPAQWLHILALFAHTKVCQQHLTLTLHGALPATPHSESLVCLHSSPTLALFRPVQTVRWLPHEVDLLLALTREHGPGSWAAILSAANGQLGDRTQVDLKDKWRNLTRSLNPEAVAIQEEHAAAEALGQFQNEEHILQGGGGDEEMQDEAGEEQEQQYQYNQNQEQGEAQEQQTEPQQEEEAAAEEAAEENGEGEEPSPPKKRRGRSQRKRSG